MEKLLENIMPREEKLKIAIAQKELAEQSVALEVVAAYQNMLTNAQTFEASNDLVSSAEESYKIALGRYKAGVGSILELLNAQSALADAKKTKIGTLYDWHISKIALSKSIGELDINQLKQ